MVEAIDKAQLAEWDEKGYFKNMNRDEVVKMLPTWPIRESLRITKLAEQKDVAALIAITQQAGSVNGPTFEDGGRDWRCKLAAEALATCGGKEVPALREAIGNGPTNQSWLIYALGKSPAPAALAVLDDLSKKEKGGDCDNVAYAIFLKGEAGKKLLSQIVERDDNGMRAAAKRWLEKPPSDAFSWPRPDAARYRRACQRSNARSDARGSAARPGRHRRLDEASGVAEEQQVGCVTLDRDREQAGPDDRLGRFIPRRGCASGGTAPGVVSTASRVWEQ